jgi:hypothetical protein
MKSISSLVLAFCLAAGCAAPRTDNTLAGSWRFADIRNAATLPDTMTPPLFDEVDFAAGGVIKLRDNLRKREFNGQYTVRDQTIEWSFQPGDTPSPVRHAVHFAFTPDGELALRSANAEHSREGHSEWIFLRPDRFLPVQSVSGEWIASPATDDPTSRVLRADGTIRNEGRSGAEGEESWGYYRLWRAPADGLMLTTVMWIQGHGAYATFERVIVDSTTTTLDPRVPPMLEPTPKRVWKRITK